jgi:hypothetical protein
MFRAFAPYSIKFLGILGDFVFIEKLSSLAYMSVFLLLAVCLQRGPLAQPCQLLLNCSNLPNFVLCLMF